MCQCAAYIYIYIHIYINIYIYSKHHTTSGGNVLSCVVIGFFILHNSRSWILHVTSRSGQQVLIEINVVTTIYCVEAKTLTYKYKNEHIYTTASYLCSSSTSTWW
jgi:hypothetical protein